MNNKIIWEGADDSWRGKLKGAWSQIKLLWRGWFGFGRKRLHRARPVQPELPVAAPPAKDGSPAGCRTHLGRHHSRGNRDVRGQR